MELWNEIMEFWNKIIELWNEIIEILIVNWQKLPAEIYIIVSN